MRSFLRLVGMVALLLFLAGCWSRKEIDELHIVAGTGIDSGEKPGMVRVTVQVINPGGLRSQGGGGMGSGGGGGGQGAAVWIGSAEGETVFDAIRNMVIQTARRLYFPHNQVLVIGEEAARKGVRPYLDFFLRDQEGRSSIYLFTCKGKAADVLKAQVAGEQIPALGLANIQDVASLSGKTHAVTIHDFINRLLVKSTSAVAPTIQLFPKEGKKYMRIVGLCFFKGDRLVGHLNAKESRGVLWLRGEMKGGIIVTQSPGERGKVSLESFSTKMKVTPRLENGRVHMNVEIVDECVLGGSMAAGNMTTEEAIRSLERRKATAIRQDVEAALKKAREYKTDFFGFGEAIHRKYPREWKDLQKRWDTVFPQIEVSVVIKARLRSVGMTTRSLTPQ